MTEQVTNLIALREGKRRARVLLSKRYGEALIDADELAVRLELVENAETLAALEPSIADLVEPGTTAGSLLRVSAPSATLVHSPDTAFHKLVSAFALTTRGGLWTPARNTQVVCVFGEVELDFRAAELAAGVTTIELSVSCSKVRLIVRPGLAVHVGALMLFSALQRDPGIPTQPRGASEPSLHIGGRAFLSHVRLELGERPMTPD